MKPPLGRRKLGEAQFTVASLRNLLGEIGLEAVTIATRSRPFHLTKCEYIMNKRIALVTGASRGIGSAIARVFREAGASVLTPYAR